MPGRRPGAANAVPTRVTDYAPDARGEALFGSLAAVHQRGMSGHEGSVYSGDRGSPEASFNGDMGRPMQHFFGAAALGTIKPGVTQPNDLAHGLSTDTLNDPALRIFAARARRQAML